MYIFSLVKIQILYEVIGDPPSNGIVQLMSTFEPLIVVVTFSGVFGYRGTIITLS